MFEESKSSCDGRSQVSIRLPIVFSIQIDDLLFCAIAAKEYKEYVRDGFKFDIKTDDFDLYYIEKGEVIPVCGEEFDILYEMFSKRTPLTTDDGLEFVEFRIVFEYEGYVLAFNNIFNEADYRKSFYVYKKTSNGFKLISLKDNKDIANKICEEYKRYICNKY